jgi:hypothetical protein
MPNKIRWTALAALAAVAGLLLGCATFRMRAAERRRMEAEAFIADWSGPSRAAAAALIAQFGAPDEVDVGNLLWRDKPPFKRVAVWNQVAGEAPEPEGDFIEQAVAYRVPPEKLDALSAFSAELLVAPDGRELAARASSRESAFLELNLADEIVRGGKTPDEARLLYLRTMQLKAAGKTSPLTQGLTFPPTR